MGAKLPLTYYNLINEDISKKEDTKDYGTIPGVNQDVPNPNAINRPTAWPITWRQAAPACPVAVAVDRSTGPAGPGQGEALENLGWCQMNILETAWCAICKCLVKVIFCPIAGMYALGASE